MQIFRKVKPHPKLSAPVITRNGLTQGPLNYTKWSGEHSRKPSAWHF